MVCWPDDPQQEVTTPVLGFRHWRVTEDGLCSLRTGVVWHDRVMTAACRPQRVEDLVLTPHEAPHPRCTCGIHAYHRFDGAFCEVDHRGVSGIVTLWGRREVDERGLRAQHARVECLGVYARSTRRHRDAVRAVGEALGCDVVDLHDLPLVAAQYGRAARVAALSSTTGAPAPFFRAGVAPPR